MDRRQVVDMEVVIHADGRVNIVMLPISNKIRAMIKIQCSLASLRRLAMVGVGVAMG